MKLSHLPVVLGLVVRVSSAVAFPGCRTPELPPGIRDSPAAEYQSARKPLAKCARPLSGPRREPQDFIGLGFGEPTPRWAGR